jgi:hypothetical protein
MRVKKLELGDINVSSAHFAIFSDSAIEAGWPEAKPVALVGSPHEGVVPFQLLFNEGDPAMSELGNRVRREVNFYFVELNEADPWKYAQYHAGTASNVYGDLHWSYRA